MAPGYENMDNLVKTKTRTDYWAKPKSGRVA
jgi:hypothetical protein